MNSLRRYLSVYFFASPLSLILFNGNIQDQSGGTNIRKEICYIGNFFTKPGTQFVTIDMIEWFHGENAVNAYKKDHPKNTSSPPEGYYIRNSAVRWDTLAIADTALFVMQTYSHDNDGNFRRNEKIDFDNIVRLFSESKQNQYRHIPFWIVTSHGRVLSITEQYIP